MRDRIRLGLGGLKAFGEVWGTSRRSERDTKRIARSVFALDRVGSSSGSAMTTPEIAELPYVEPVVQQVVIGGTEMDAVGWQDLREMDYFAMLDSMEQQGLDGIST